MIDRVTNELGKMSRSGRAIIMLGGAVLLVLAWSSIFSPLAARWAEAADSIESQTERVERATSQAAAQRSNVIAFGPVNPPTRRATESQDMLEAVRSIMAAHQVRDYDFNEASSAVKVGAATLPGVERIRSTLDFETDNEDAIDIIAELEDSPSIEAISSAKVQKGKSARSLAVQLTLEAWTQGGARR